MASRVLQSSRGPSVPKACLAAFPLLGQSSSAAIPTSSAKFFSSPVQFLLGAGLPDQFPAPVAHGSIAFAGRSNVGKSSLINTLFHNAKLARVSATPGRTQQLNFFSPTNSNAHVVDFPGYGFAAHSPKSEAAAWQNLVGEYVRSRSDSIKAIYILMDSRRGLTSSDTQFMQFLNESHVPFQCVLTKIDKVSSRDYTSLVNILQLYFTGRLEVARCIQLHRMLEDGGAKAVSAVDELSQLNAPSNSTAPSELIYSSCLPFVHVTSSETGFGLPELRASLATQLGIRKPTAPIVN